MCPQRLYSLQDIGIDFQFGYETFPLPNLRQVLWFRLELAATSMRSPSQTFYWIEQASGAVIALRVNDLECSPERFVQSLAYLPPSLDEEQALTERLCLNWLVPPAFRAANMPDALLCPNMAFIFSAVREQILMALSMPKFAVSLSERTYDLLVEFNRQAGKVLLEESVLQHHEEIFNVIEQLDGVADFLALSQGFKGKLSPKICSALDEWMPLSDSQMHTIKNYNTIGAWSDAQHRNRNQAKSAFPWLHHELVLKNGVAKNSRKLPEMAKGMDYAISTAVDSGEPLLATLARRYGVSKHTLRYAKKFLQSRIRSPETIPVILWFLDCIKPDMRPSAADDINVLNNVIDWIAGWNQESDRIYVDKVARTLFEDGISGFRSLRKKWCPNVNPDDPFDDVIDYLGNTQESFDVSVKEWISGTGLLALFAEAERWHVLQWSDDIEIEVKSWDPLIPHPTPLRNLVAYELNDTLLLFDEGKAMRHCIAAYASMYKTDRNFMFSLRNMVDGKRRSTLHVQLNEVELFTICQHRSFANQEPDQECMEAADTLINLLNDLSAPYRKIGARE